MLTDNFQALRRKNALQDVQEMTPKLLPMRKGIEEMQSIERWAHLTIGMAVADATGQNLLVLFFRKFGSASFLVAGRFDR